MTQRNRVTATEWAASRGDNRTAKERHQAATKEHNAARCAAGERMQQRTN